MIYEYAFREQAIAVSYAGGEKIRFMAEPHDYPIARRYPFSDLLARTTIVERFTTTLSNCPCASIHSASTTSI
jgi:hypothetical protein